MGIVTIPPKYQVVIPKEIREWLGLVPGQKVQAHRLEVCALAAGDGRNGTENENGRGGQFDDKPGQPKETARCPRCSGCQSVKTFPGSAPPVQPGILWPDPWRC